MLISFATLLLLSTGTPVISVDQSATPPMSAAFTWGDGIQHLDPGGWCADGEITENGDLVCGSGGSGSSNPHCDGNACQKRCENTGTYSMNNNECLYKGIETFLGCSTTDPNDYHWHPANN